MDVVKRANALVAVRAGTSSTESAIVAGYTSNDTVSRLVNRFNQRGLLALSVAAGRGRKPDHKKDQTGTWSLMTLRRALRKSDLPHIGAETIRQVLHESGYSYQRTRTWCRTGYALRKRKGGTVTVYDPETRGAKRIIELAYEQAEAAGIVQLNEDEAGPYQAIPQPGARLPTGRPSSYSTTRV